MTIKQTISWSEIKKYRNRLPPLRKLKLIADHKNFCLNFIGKEDAVLDIGCGRGEILKEYLLPNGFVGEYVGVDTDPTLKADFPFYSTLNDVSDKFDIILMFDVIEHMTLNELSKCLYSIVTKPLLRGKLLISTPNVYSLAYLHKDVTHRTFYPYQDLYGILKHFGFKNISIFRVGRITPLTLLRVPLLYLLDMDFCGNILAAASLG